MSSTPAAASRKKSTGGSKRQSPLSSPSTSKRASLTAAQGHSSQSSKKQQQQSMAAKSMDNVSSGSSNSSHLHQKKNTLTKTPSKSSQSLIAQQQGHNGLYAGAKFQNSPDPSSLPLPSFSSPLSSSLGPSRPPVHIPYTQPLVPQQQQQQQHQQMMVGSWEAHQYPPHQLTHQQNHSRVLSFPNLNPTSSSDPLQQSQPHPQARQSRTRMDSTGSLNHHHGSGVFSMELQADEDLEVKSKQLLNLLNPTAPVTLTPTPGFPPPMMGGFIPPPHSTHLPPHPMIHPTTMAPMMPLVGPSPSMPHPLLAGPPFYNQHPHLQQQQVGHPMLLDRMGADLKNILNIQQPPQPPPPVQVGPSPPGYLSQRNHTQEPPS